MTSFVQPDLFGRATAQSWPFGALALFGADLIMADPPWSWQAYSDKGLGKSPDYGTMSLDAIAALPVADLAADDCLLWLWATAPLLPEALGVMTAWGFRYVTSGVWHKRTVNDRTAFGTGYVLRNSHELFLIGKIGEPKTTRGVRSVVMGRVREHSRKPDEAYAAAEALMPGARRYELFSRQTRPGWDAWGDEAGKFDTGDDDGHR